MIMKITGELALLGAIASVFFVAARGRAAEKAAEEAAGTDYMRTLDVLMSKAKNKRVVAQWNYETNITTRTEAFMVRLLESQNRGEWHIML